MIRRVKIAAPNSVLLLEASSSVQVPNVTGDGIVWATNNCVAVGTLCEVDGETTVVLSDEAVGLDGMAAEWTGTVDTTGLISLKTTTGETLATLRCSPGEVRLGIHLSDRSEPDRIVVIVGSG